MQFPVSLSTIHYRVGAVLWTLGMLGGFLIPADTLTAAEPALDYDKGIHFLLFAGFGAFWMRAVCPRAVGRVPKRLRRRALWVLLAGTGFALATEGIQHAAPVGRVADPYDALANLLGLSSAVGIYGYVLRSRARSGRGERCEPEGQTR